MNHFCQTSDIASSAATKQKTAAFGICTGLILLLYAPVLAPLVRDWINLPDFSQGFVIVPISLYLVWQKRETLRNTPPTPSNWGLLVLAFGLLLFFLGSLGAEIFTQRFSLLVVIAGIVLFLLGKDHLKSLAFPLAFLIFMIPPPSILFQKITFPMQLFASGCAYHMLDFWAIPAIREGNVLYLPNITLNVVGACSGIRSLIALLTLATLLAYFKNKALWQRSLVIFSTIPIAIFVNALRVFLTALLSYHFGARAAEGLFHESAGLLLFLVAALIFYG
ncbi:MAG: exosortase/archaeosortase family protein, partial [Syntrophobacteraceae bacterium]